MPSDIASLIGRIERREREGVSELEHRLDEGEFIGRAKKPMDLVKVYLRFDPESKSLRFFDNTDDENKDRWANAADGVPVVRQLITDPHLIVDLKAVQSDKECVEEYGVTSEQLYQLAAKDFVRFNLYEYDSTRNHPEGPFAPYATSECRYMDALLDPSEGWCRITSIRKEAFFNRLVGGEDYSYASSDQTESRFGALVNEGKQRFGPLIREASTREKSRMGLRQLDTEKAVEITARHFAYVQAVIEGSDPKTSTDKVQKAAKWLERVKAYGDDPEQRVRTVRHIKGLKNLIATDYTASMGGTYNMGAHTLGPYLDLHEFDKGIRDIEGVEDRESAERDRVVRLRKANQQLQPIHEFVERVRRDQLATDTDVPAPMSFRSQTDFIGYLERIVEPLRNREAQNRISDLHVAVTQHSENEGKKIETLQDLLQARQEAFELARREQQSRDLVFDVASVIIGTVTTASIGIPIVANLLSQLFGTLTEEYRNTEAIDLMSDSKRNLVSRMQDVESIFGVKLQRA